MVSPQSVGFQLEAQLTTNTNFERLSSYAADDPLRQLSQSVGRLDILYRGKGVVTCTASVILPEYILTNAHCLPGPQKLGRPDRASLLMGFYTSEQDRTQRYDVEVTRHARWSLANGSRKHAPSRRNSVPFAHIVSPDSNAGSPSKPCFAPGVYSYLHPV